MLASGSVHALPTFADRSGVMATFIDADDEWNGMVAETLAKVAAAVQPSVVSIEVARGLRLKVACGKSPSSMNNGPDANVFADGPPLSVYTG